MRIALDWLGEFIDLPADDALTDRLEMGGFEDVFVEGGALAPGVQVGHVDAREAHPDADRLSVCRVDVGDGTPRQIVCGAPNVAAGQKVAVALPGTRLPEGTKIKKSKLRGVVSEGMICSRRELGRGDDQDGIWVLETDAAPGTPLDEAVPPEGRVLEVGITPNRGDTASVLGLAREVRAFFGGALRLPAIALDESGAAAAESVRIAIDAGDGCHHYAARIVRGVRVGPSPDWVQRRLEASGVRAINNVVDVTNLVLLELGQPLHAFDLARIAGGEIRVRRARSGEKLVTLDGEKRALDPSDLLICDAERAVALAGVMGGADSEVHDATTDVLIESAHFAPSTIRLTARRHGLHSEASYRFERGVDREGIARAADRAAQLIAELAGGTVAPGRVETRGDPAPVTEEIAFLVARASDVLGIPLSAAEAARHLERVGVACRAGGADTLVCRVPSHRNDLHRQEDLTEEVARIHGYEHIPTTLPLARLQPTSLPPGWVMADRVRDALAGEGLVEVETFPFVSDEEIARLGLAPGDPRARTLRILNPIQDQDSRLRGTLVPSLLRVARQNLARQADAVNIFEVCRVFVPRGDDAGENELPQEPLSAVILVADAGARRLWEPADPPPLYFRVRGIAERLLSSMGYVSSLRRQGGATFLHPGARAEIEVDGAVVGDVGELHPTVARSFEIEVPCALIELNLSALLAAKKRDFQFREVSREPSVRRDIAVLLDREQAAGEIVAAARSVGGEDLVSVELFDRYEGRGVPEGRVSLAVRLVFQRADRTLTDTEVTKAVDRVVQALTERFGAQQR